MRDWQVFVRGGGDLAEIPWPWRYRRHSPLYVQCVPLKLLLERKSQALDPVPSTHSRKVSQTLNHKGLEST